MTQWKRAKQPRRSDQEPEDEPQDEPDMNQNDGKPSFLDRGTILAFALILLFWFGWSRFMETKYPQQPAATNAAQAPATSTTATNAAPGTAPQTSAPAANAPSAQASTAQAGTTG